MADTRTSGQSVRRAARQAAIAAQAKRRAQAAERDKRLDAAANCTPSRWWTSATPTRRRPR